MPTMPPEYNKRLWASRSDSYKRQNNALCRARYAALIADPATAEALREKRRQTYLRRKAEQQCKPKTPPTPDMPLGRRFELMSLEEQRAYSRLRVTRKLARLHALQKNMDLYTVYKQWGCLFIRDKQGMRNPLETKRKQTVRTLEPVT